MPLSRHPRDNSCDNYIMIDDGSIIMMNIENLISFAMKKVNLNRKNVVLVLKM